MGDHYPEIPDKLIGHNLIKKRKHYELKDVMFKEYVHEIFERYSKKHPYLDAYPIREGLEYIMESLIPATTKDIEAAEKEIENKKDFFYNLIPMRSVKALKRDSMEAKLEKQKLERSLELISRYKNTKENKE